MSDKTYMGESSLSSLWGKIKAGFLEKTANAVSASKLYTKRYIDGMGFDGSASITHYGTCSTSGATAAKTVSLSGFSLVTGARIVVYFSYANTASSATLNVNSTGAKPIYYRNSYVLANYIEANSLVELVYSGSYWRIVGDMKKDVINSITIPVLPTRTSLYTGSIYASTTKTWQYTTIANLSTYSEVELWVTVADIFAMPVRINKSNTGQMSFTAYFNSGWNASVRVLVDWSNNRVGVYIHSITGYTNSMVNVSKIVGIK